MKPLNVPPSEINEQLSLFPFPVGEEPGQRKQIVVKELELPLVEEHVHSPAAAAGCEEPARPIVPDRPEQQLGRLRRRNGFYEYQGWVWRDEQYSEVTYWFTAKEAGVVEWPDLADQRGWFDRLRTMIDAVGRNDERQQEIKRFGPRVWHSVLRPESATMQALDYAFLHNVDLSGLVWRSAEPLFAGDPEVAVTWTVALHEAYLRKQQDRQVILLQQIDLSEYEIQRILLR